MHPKNTTGRPAPAGKKARRLFLGLGVVLLIAALLFGGFLAFLTVTEYRPEPIEPALSGGADALPMLESDALKILTFNMGYASLGKDADFLMDGGKGPGHTDRKTLEANLDGLESILQASGADVLMLQEIDRASARSFDINQLDTFAAALPGYGWRYAPNFLCPFVPYPPKSPFGRIDSGVATYSRHQVHQAQRVSLPVPFTWPLRVANLKRCMLVTRLPLEASDNALVVINFHLEAYDSGEGKQAQTRQLLDLMQAEYQKGNFVIAGGDFNQIFPGVQTITKPTSQWVPGSLDPFPENMDGWRYVYDDSVPTCRLLNQPYRPEDPMTQHYVIDGFIVSPNVEVVSVETLDEGFVYSDHNPILMNVKLTPSAP